MLQALLISLSALIPIGAVISFFVIRHLYRVYDEKQTLKEEIEQLKQKIKGADDYFYKNYNTDFDSSVYRNIKPKIDFCTRLIDKESLQSQKKHYDDLFKRLYETGYRLKTSFDNVSFIIAPLNEFYKQLAREHIEFIKENSEEYKNF